MSRRPASQDPKYRRAVFAQYGRICWLCGHPGANQVDHVVSVTERPDLEWAVSNGRPAHGAPRNKCPQCHLNCNQIRGGYSPERARRIIAERGGHPMAEPKPARDAGREW